MPQQPASVRAVEAALARMGEAYLVGSANWGLPGVAADHDYALRGDTLSIGAILATTYGGKHVVMDAERRHVRVVLPRVGVLDVAPLVGDSLTTDLAARDFTLNAVGAALPDRRPVLDPFRGLTDLRYGVVRQVSMGSMRADPLRVLRAIRLVAKRGFEIEAETLACASAAAPLLSGVRPERVHTELLRALSAPGWFAAANLLLDLCVWPALPWAVPLAPDRECYRLQLDRLRAAQTRLRALPSLPGWPGTSAALGEAVAMAVVAAVMKASALPAEATAAAARSLRFTNKQVGLLESILRAGDEMAASANAVRNAAGVSSGYTDGARLAGEYGFGAVLAAVLGERAATLEALLALRPVPPGLLPSGAEVLARLGRRPGPWLGALLRSLQQAALRGDIADRRDAWLLAERLARPAHDAKTLPESTDDATG